MVNLWVWDSMWHNGSPNSLVALLYILYLHNQTLKTVCSIGYGWEKVIYFYIIPVLYPINLTSPRLINDF